MTLLCLYAVRRRAERSEKLQWSFLVRSQLVGGVRRRGSISIELVETKKESK